MPRVIRIDPHGRLGSRVEQYALARILQRSCPDAVITGMGLPEFGIVSDAEPAELLGPKPERMNGPLTPAAANIVRIERQSFPFGATVDFLRHSDTSEIVIAWVNHRIEYYRRHRAALRRLFPIDPALPTGFGARHLVINIRCEDVLRGIHPNYTVLPLAWYAQLIATTGLTPVFVGQIGDDVYGDALRARFPRARFHVTGEPMHDFNILRTSRNVVLSVSNFSWWATWLSETAQRLHFPVAGMFHPVDRPDVDMLPMFDRRYRFHLFPCERWTASPEQMDAKINGPAHAREIRWPLLFRLRVGLGRTRAQRRALGLTLWRDLKAAMPLMPARWCRSAPAVTPEPEATGSPRLPGR